MKRLLVTVMALTLFVGFSTLEAQVRNFSLVWDGGIGDADPDLTGPLPPNLIRAWGMIGNTQFGPLDIDKDQNNEFISYDATNKRIFVYESTGDNEYAVVWFKDKIPSSGEDVLFGGERSVIITDLDNDGNFELINVWDSFSPGIIDTGLSNPDTTIVGTDTTIAFLDTVFSGGFNALELYEHDPSSGDFLPDTPTLTYDPPRNSRARIALEFMSVATDVDGDGVVELILTYRDKFGLILSIISLPGGNFASPDWMVEYVDSTTTSDSSGVDWQVHSMTVGDLDGDGLKDMVVQIDGDFMPIIVYTATAPNTYSRVVFDSSAYHADYRGSAAKLVMADINSNGKTEVYLGARGGKIWIVSGIVDVATAFNAANFTLIADIPTFEGSPNDGVELRGGEFGDADNNGRNSFYVTARDPYEAIYDIEWVGGTGGDVTDVDNYQMFNIYQDTTTAFTVGFVSMAIGDYDGDGPAHKDIVFTTGNGNAGDMPGIYLIEFDATTTDIASRGSQIPEIFSLHQNYPNPFNPETKIVYDMHEAGNVSLVVYNVLGQEVRTLFSGMKSVGTHETVWDGKDRNGKAMMSGVYFYTLKSAGFKAVRKMVLLK
ncbi:MAG: T9SS type A sorting domain-containing protein [Candidatus Marinimicrobia bacterium]|nr:T9SS type A sorting domain-containing protein [Candidatus Neomarinimicrobiota bacterium]